MAVSCLVDTAFATLSGLVFGSDRVRILETIGVPAGSLGLGLFSNAETSDADDAGCGAALLLEIVVRVDSCENRLVGLLTGGALMFEGGLLRLSVLRSSKVVSEFAVDFFNPTAVPCESLERSPLLRDVEFIPREGTMGAIGLEFAIGFWTVGFDDLVPKELSFRTTGAGCLGDS